MFHDSVRFSEPAANTEARSIGAILAALPNVAALRRGRAADSVKLV